MQLYTWGPLGDIVTPAYRIIISIINYPLPELLR